MNIGLKLIRERLDELGYLENISEYEISDYIDEIIDIVNEYRIDLEDVENLLTYEINYEYKKDIIDNSDGIYIYTTEEGDR